MNRRTLLSAFFGAAAIMLATPLIAARPAEAMPVVHPDASALTDRAVSTDVATEQDLLPTKIEKAQYWYHRRHYHWRHHPRWWHRPYWRRRWWYRHRWHRWHHRHHHHH